MKNIYKSGVEVPANVDWYLVEQRQQLQLHTMDAVARKFEENNLKYYLVYGCLIGLLRHEGHMIPWDDDVDIAMPRWDYEKAIDILMHDKAFEVFEFTRHSDFRVKSAKVAARNVLGEVSENKERYIDIFALDKTPSCILSKYIKAKIRGLLETVVLTRKKKNHGFNRIVGKICGLLLPNDVASIHRLMVKFSSESWRRTKWSNKTLVGEMYSEYGLLEMPFSIFGDGKCVNFCGYNVRVPVDIEEYLKICYGEWRKMPPIDKRLPKHIDDDAWFYSELK